MPVPGIPEIQPGDDLVAILATALTDAGAQPGDILVIAQKIVSKAAGLLVDLAGVQPSARAIDIATPLNKDPRKVEVVLGESRRVVRQFKHPHQGEGTLICEHLSGHISANAGVDQSNIAGDDTVLLLPRDPDATAADLHQGLTDQLGLRLGVVISDTFGRPWRMGQVNVAIGLAGLPTFRSEIGTQDSFGRDLKVTQAALADELAAASGLVISKTSQTPVVIIRGVTWEETTGRAAELVRKTSEDMFR